MKYISYIALTIASLNFLISQCYGPEPFNDLDGNGAWTANESFTDLNGNDEENDLNEVIKLDK